MSKSTLVLATATLALGVSVAALVLALRPDGANGEGPLVPPSRVDNSIGAPVPMRAPFSLGFLIVRNSSKQRLELEGAHLVDAGAGIKLIGAYTLPVPNDRQIGFVKGFEPKGARFGPVAGHQRVQVILGLRVVRPGNYTFSSVTLRYRDESGRRYETSYPVSGRLCSPQAKWTGRCRNLLDQGGAAVPVKSRTFGLG